MTLDGKVALVTGSGRGIGRAIAIDLARKGANVIINDLSDSAVDAVAGEVRALGREALAIRADVTKSAQVAGMIEQTIDRFGRLDILVNNAGWANIKKFMDTDEDDWQRMLGLNLIGVMICCKVALGEMIKQPGGRIVNIASIAGQMGSGGQSIYAASKSAVIGFTKSLAQELARYQITVNAVAPGVIETELNREIWDAHPNAGSAVLKAMPLRRLGRPEDIAAMVGFLASDEAAYITGQTIGVNGGMFMS